MEVMPQPQVPNQEDVQAMIEKREIDLTKARELSQLCSALVGISSPAKLKRDSGSLRGPIAPETIPIDFSWVDDQGSTELFRDLLETCSNSELKTYQSRKLRQKQIAESGKPGSGSTKSDVRS